MSKLFKRTLIIMIVLFGIIANATSVLSGWNLYRKLTEEFKSKGTAISRSIADSSVEIILNRDASTIQAIIDQFIGIKDVSYVFVVDPQREIISHTFVPTIPEEILRIHDNLPAQGFREDTEIWDLLIEGLGDFIDISSPILAGVA